MELPFALFLLLLALLPLSSSLDVSTHWLQKQFERGRRKLDKAKEFQIGEASRAYRNVSDLLLATAAFRESAEIFERAAARYNASFMKRAAKRAKSGKKPKQWSPTAAQHLFFAGIARYRSVKQGQVPDQQRQMAIALGHFNGVVGLYSGDEASGMKDAKAAALEWSARCYMGVQRDCDAHDQYEELLRLRHGSIAMLQPPSRLLHAAVATNCDPARALVLWDLLSDAGELDAIAEPTKCKTCWNKMDIARRVAKEHALGESKSNIARGAPPLWRWNDAAVEADAYFEEHVGPNTPWVHASQTPSEFDLALATSEPQGWHRPADHRVCAMLQEHSVTIMAEYVAWEGAFFSGHFDAEHDDAALVAKAARGWEGETEAPWQYLHLRRLRYGSRGEEPNWDEELCAKHFPETCAALRGLAEVDGSPTQPCKDGWCRGIHEVQSGQLLWQKPGLVAFYRLAPGVEVPLHSGPTNRRLKCQLVIRADGSEPSEGGSAWIEVNGIARRVLRGDVLAFDDSYLHRVANSDGASGSRVVLDVGFWHPKVKPALHTDGMFQPNLETFSTDIEEGALHHPEPEAEERSEL